ncbi:MAG TPA: hypothetical protein VMQ61_14580 [Thermoanaerobaculia bacterium]|nr:hypothetical protein [Thermoanaerobaculia bacterium]
MYRPRALRDDELSVLLERAARDPATRRDLAGYLHHSELLSTLSRGEPEPNMSAKYIDDFRAKYRLA